MNRFITALQAVAMNREFDAAADYDNIVFEALTAYDNGESECADCDAAEVCRNMWADENFRALAFSASCYDLLDKQTARDMLYYVAPHYWHRHWGGQGRKRKCRT